MNQCDEGSPDSDGQIKNFVLDKVGCKLPYWNSSSSIPLCSKHKKIEAAADLVERVAFGFDKLGAHMRSIPCRTLEKIQYDARDISRPIISSLTPGSKHFEDMIERNHLDAKKYFVFLDSINRRNTSYMMLWFDFKDDIYKEIKNIRDMDKQALIGNSRNGKRILKTF